MKTEYYLEIYDPNDSSCIAASYESDTPFMCMHIGDTIHGGSLNLSDASRAVRIRNIQHILWVIEGSHAAHKICVYTEALV